MITTSFIDLFEQACLELNFKTSSLNRKFEEKIYFTSYLKFLNNSYSMKRYVDIIEDKKIINGKYLNEKLNRWTNEGIFKKMYQIMILNYIRTEKFKQIRYLSIDSQFIPNRNMAKNKVGRNGFYKSKYGLKLSAIVDNNGIPLLLLLKSGNIHDSIML